MKIALFVPCYIDQLYPEVAIATLKVFKKVGLMLDVPPAQTCCGQPLANSGFEHLADPCSSNFQEKFAGYDYVVSPSGSCILHLKEHALPPSNSSPKLFELVEFLVDIAQVKNLRSHFPHRVGLHQSCHGLRGLGLAKMSELMVPEFSKTETLLNLVNGLELIPLSRRDECCGFGGTFSVMEEAVSVKMGKDRLADHEIHGAEYITGNDMSCLMHLDGLLRRQNSKTRVIHLAEILAAD